MTLSSALRALGELRVLLTCSFCSPRAHYLVLDEPKAFFLERRLSLGLLSLAQLFRLLRGIGSPARALGVSARVRLGDGHEDQRICVVGASAAAAADPVLAATATHRDRHDCHRAGSGGHVAAAAAVAAATSAVASAPRLRRRHDILLKAEARIRAEERAVPESYGVVMMWHVQDHRHAKDGLLRNKR